MLVNIVHSDVQTCRMTSTDLCYSLHQQAPQGRTEYPQRYESILSPVHFPHSNPPNVRRLAKLGHRLIHGGPLLVAVLWRHQAVSGSDYRPSALESRDFSAKSRRVRPLQKQKKKKKKKKKKRKKKKRKKKKKKTLSEAGSLHTQEAVECKGSCDSLVWHHVCYGAVHDQTNKRCFLQDKSRAG